MKYFVILLSSLFILSCSNEEGNYLVKTPPPIEMAEEKITDLEGLIFSPKVDILFVVDDSGSMGTHQRNLSSNIGLFISELAKDQILDYNIGVVSSDMSKFDRQGRLLGFPAVVTRHTPGGLGTLQANLLVGTNGSYLEQFFGPVIAALTSPLVDGVNAGFYRPEAHLAIIFITDTEDQTPVSVAYYLNFLERLKGGDKDKILAYGVLVPPGIPGCNRDDPSKGRIEEVMTQLKGITFSLCDPDFGIKLAGLGANLSQRVGSFIPLNQLPDVKTIRVTYGTQVIPNDPHLGWVYVPNRVGLKLGLGLELEEQPEGTQLKVDFVPANKADGGAFHN